MKLNSYFTHCIVHNIYIDHINTLFGGQTSTQNGPAIGSMNLTHLVACMKYMNQKAQTMNEQSGIQKGKKKRQVMLKAGKNFIS